MSISLRCTSCQITFETKEAYNTHKEKFCINSDYADSNKLLRTLQLEDKNRRAKEMGAMGVQEMTDHIAGRGNGSDARTNLVGSVLGEKSLADLRASFTDDDRQTRVLLKQMESQRKRNKADELKGLKARFQQVRPNPSK